MRRTRRAAKEETLLSHKVILSPDLLPMVLSFVPTVDCPAAVCSAWANSWRLQTPSRLARQPYDRVCPLVARLCNHATTIDTESATAELLTLVSTGLPDEETLSHHHPYQSAVAEACGIPAIVALLRQGVGESDPAYRARMGERFEAVALLKHLSGNSFNRAAIESAGGIPPLVNFLKFAADASTPPSRRRQGEEALRCLCMLAGSPDDCAEAIVAAGGIAPIVELMRDGHTESMVFDAAFTLQNLAYAGRERAHGRVSGGFDFRVPMRMLGAVEELELLHDGDDDYSTMRQRLIAGRALTLLEPETYGEPDWDHD